MIKAVLAGALLPGLALTLVLTHSDFIDKLKWRFFGDSAAMTLAGKTVIFGDSIALGLNAGEMADDAINLASNGWTMLQVISQIDRLAAQSRGLENARQIIVMIGINDAYWRDADQMIVDYRRMVALIPDTVPVLLSAVLAVNESKSAAAFGENWFGANTKVQKLNKAIENVASAQGWGFMKIQLTDEHRKNDGLHLNDDGYRVLSKAVRSQLANMPVDSGI